MRSVAAGGKGTNLAGSKAVCCGNGRILLLWRYYFRVEVTPSETDGKADRQRDEQTDRLTGSNSAPSSSLQSNPKASGMPQPPPPLQMKFVPN